MINRDVIRALKNLSSENSRFDILYFDPPYDSDIYTPGMWQLAKSDLIAEDGVVIVEHRRQTPLQQNYDKLRPYRQVTQGESILTFFGVESETARSEADEGQSEGL